MTVLVSIVALCVVIMLHELGHYLAAIWTGMKVDRFSVFGLGPKLVSLGTWRGTEFTISWVPFGAYVVIRGMEPEDDSTPPPPKAAEESVNFRDKPLWARALVLFGGPAANYLAAMVILFGVFALAGVRGPHEELRVASFGKDSAAETAGMALGDELVSIGGQAVDPAKGVAGVNELTEPQRGETVPVLVQRGGQAVELKVDLPAEGAALGIAFEPPPRYAVPVGDAMAKAVAEPLEVTAQQLGGLWMLIKRETSAELTGPVGIVDHIADRAKSGLIPFLTTTAFISTLLGLFNLLPIPALDGGRLTFLLYEGVARRRANPRIEESVHAWGLLALLALIAVITYGDVRRLM